MMTEPVFCENPYAALADTIRQTYPNGVVGIVGCPKAELSKLLIEGGNPVEIGGAFGEHVCCVVGAGGYREIKKARKEAKGKRLLLLTGIIDKICYSPYCENGNAYSTFKVPEKVFYSYNTTRHTRGSAYASLMGLLFACADAALCYADCKAMITLAERIKKMLSEPLEIKKCAQLLAKASSIFSRMGGELLYEVAFGKQSHDTADSVFFTNYLAIASLIQFTKLDFNGIFIGKDRTFLQDVALRGNLCRDALISRASGEFLKEVLPNNSDLSRYSERYLWESGARYFKTPCASVLFDRFLEAEERVKDQGLFATLCRVGFIDKLNNGEDKWN
ncbi:MAG: hypothetical protein PHI19_01470 [Clostridia bacterium]|nr:hypothetical protein [Clostridia bacterium]